MGETPEEGPQGEWELWEHRFPPLFCSLRSFSQPFPPGSSSCHFPAASSIPPAHPGGLWRVQGLWGAPEGNHNPNPSPSQPLSALGQGVRLLSSKAD